MFFQNKLIILISLLLVVVGGITFAFSTIDVFGKNDNKKVIEESSFTNIEVLTNNAAVVIVPTQSSEATVEYTGEGKKAKFKFDVDVKGDTLSVEFKEKRRFFFWFSFGSDLTLTLNIPEKQYENIRVESDNGSIKAGDIQVEDIELETDNGQIELKKAETYTVNLETDNGKIVLEDVEGDITGSSDNGRITMTTKSLDQPIELETDNGSIEIKTDTEPTNATIETKVDNGEVMIFGNEDTRAIYGDGKHLIKLETDNGRITVTK